MEKSKMNKSERLNDMMIYLNNLSYFNIKDLTERYGISKSTALRDIQSLESIGMPIFSEYGRNGRYGILKNRLLSPIFFTMDEVYAIYFSTLTLKEFQSTPFDLDLQKLKEKFESCISEKNKMNLEKMETVFSFSSSKQINDCIFLKEILYSAINSYVNDIIYRRSDKDYKYTVQFLNVSTSFGQWYTTAYNHLLNCINIFRCDKIISISENKDIEAIEIQNTDEFIQDNMRQKDAIEFEIAITKKGVDIFIKENYPSMKLNYKDNQAMICGYYNKNEEDFISNYLMSFGEEIISIKPKKLKKLLVSKIQCILNYTKKL